MPFHARLAPQTKAVLNGRIDAEFPGHLWGRRFKPQNPVGWSKPWHHRFLQPLRDWCCGVFTNEAFVSDLVRACVCGPCACPACTCVLVDWDSKLPRENCSWAPVTRPGCVPWIKRLYLTFLSAGPTHALVKGVACSESVERALSPLGLSRACSSGSFPACLNHTHSNRVTDPGPRSSRWACQSTAHSTKLFPCLQRRRNAFQENSFSPFVLRLQAQRAQGWPTSLRWLFTFLSPNLSNMLAALEPGERTQIKGGAAAVRNKHRSQV